MYLWEKPDKAEVALPEPEEALPEPEETLPEPEEALSEPEEPPEPEPVLAGVPDNQESRHVEITKRIASLTMLLIIMWGYVLMGASIFMLVEGNVGENYDVLADRYKILFKTMEQLVKVHGKDFTGANTTFQIEATKILKEHEKAFHEVLKKKEEFDTNKWTYEASLLFAATLVTSVGYGNIAPTTSFGRLFTIIYSCIGIPLTLLCIGMMGNIMAHGFKTIVFFLFEDVVTDEGEPYIPIKVSLSIMFGYLFLGAVLFRSVGENWTFLESFYFCFITLSTIGLGDFVYGESSTHDTNFLASVAYIIVGLSILSMCFNLIQDQATYKMHKLINVIALRLQRIYNKAYKKCFKNQKKVTWFEKFSV